VDTIVVQPATATVQLSLSVIPVRDAIPKLLETRAYGKASDRSNVEPPLYFRLPTLAVDPSGTIPRVTAFASEVNEVTVEPDAAHDQFAFVFGVKYGLVRWKNWYAFTLRLFMSATSSRDDRTPRHPYRC
jgi:hypothetical protein